MMTGSNEIIDENLDSTLSDADWEELSAMLNPEADLNLAASSDLPLSVLHQQLQARQFKDAAQTIKNDPAYLKEIDSTVSIEQLIPFFLFGLKNRLAAISQSIWENSPKLRTYFSGVPITIHSENATENTKAETVQLTSEELLSIFNAALSTQRAFIITAIWRNSERLQTLVKQLEDEKLTILTKKVLASHTSGKRSFMSVFVDSISNLSVLKNCLNDLDLTPPISDYKRKQRNILKARIQILSPRIPVHINSLFMEMIKKRPIHNQSTDNNLTKLQKTDNPTP